MQRHPAAVFSSGYGSVAAIKACSILKDINGGLQAHCHVVDSGLLETNPFVGCALVSMYAKCGSLVKAEQVFIKLSSQDVVSWTALIAAYADQGQCKKAVKCFHRMYDVGVLPNEVTFACILPACSSIVEGQELHTELERLGMLKNDKVLGNSLVGMYAKLGFLGIAREVFKTLSLLHSVVAWTLLISSYVEHGGSDEALECFNEMRTEGVIPNAVTYVSCLKACSHIGNINTGRDIHVELERQGLLEGDPVVSSSLLKMYGQCGLPGLAKEVFNRLQVRCLITWNALLSSVLDYGDSEETFKWFEQIQLEGTFPDVVTFVSSLTACRNLKFIGKGKELHVRLESLGMLEKEPTVTNALIDLYAKCGPLGMARRIFDKLKLRDVVSWTALMAGYVDDGHCEEALECLEQMTLEGVCPDPIAFACSLKACRSMGATDRGREIHIKIDELGLLRRDAVVGNTLVNMYIRNDFLSTGKDVFDKLLVRDDVSWNTIISGFIDQGLGEEALTWLDGMRSKGISPSPVTFVSALKACGSVGAINKGEDLHAEIETLGLFGKDLVVGNTLVGMYVANGLLARAADVFDKLLVRDVVSWTTLMVGYSQLGAYTSVFLIFEKMLRDCVKPDSVAFVVLLTVCARSSEFSKSRTIFEKMTRDHGIVPHVKHHGCILNLAGQAGQLDIAAEILNILPSPANIEMWCTFLGSCRSWGSLYLGKQAFESFELVKERKIY